MTSKLLIHYDVSLSKITQKASKPFQQPFMCANQVSQIYIQNKINIISIFPFFVQVTLFITEQISLTLKKTTYKYFYLIIRLVSKQRSLSHSTFTHATTQYYSHTSIRSPLFLSVILCAYQPELKLLYNLRSIYDDVKQLQNISCASSRHSSRNLSGLPLLFGLAGSCPYRCCCCYCCSEESLYEG